MDSVGTLDVQLSTANTFRVYTVASATVLSSVEFHFLHSTSMTKVDL
jgi:hypothetical protein